MSTPSARSASGSSLAGRVARGLVDFLYPPLCGLCHARLAPGEQAVCFRCLAEVAFRPDWRCGRCGAFGVGVEPGAGSRCRHCPPAGAHYAGVLAAVAYHGAGARMVQRFKYNRRLEIGAAMARVTAQRLAEPLALLGRRVDCIVPVPLHLLRRLERGFNQAHALAGAVAGATALPVRDLLRRRRYTRRQALLPRERRDSNVQGAFALRGRHDLHGQGILLIDDVVTSGATVNECARVLREAGAREVWVVCFARTGLGPHGPDANE